MRISVTPPTDGQILTEKAKEKCRTKARKLLNKLKKPLEPNMLWFFSDEKKLLPGSEALPKQQVDSL